MDLSFIKLAARNGANIMASAYASAFDSITVNRYASAVDITGRVTSAISATVTTGARRMPISFAYDNKLIPDTLVGKTLMAMEMVNGSSVTFIPAPNDEVVTSDGTWMVLGCTPTDKDGLGITFGLGLVKK